MNRTRSRRDFLRAAAALAGGAPRLAPFAASLAGLGALATRSAGAADGYRALVCLFMNGGNDGHNVVIPADDDGYAEYAAARNTLALPREQLLPIALNTSQGSGRSFALHPNLGPLRDLYASGRAAVVANVGTLLQPTMKQDFQQNLHLPPKLFSHNDQISTWQALAPEGAPSGWGGRMADSLLAGNAKPTLTAVSIAGNAVFLAGHQVVQYQVAAAGAPRIEALASWEQHGSDLVPSVLRSVLAMQGSNAFQADWSSIVQRSIATGAALRDALAGVEVPTIPDTPVLQFGVNATAPLSGDDLALQLRMVAQLIAAAPTLGMQRQVFFVQLGGFDTHSWQLRRQASLMDRVSHSIAYFQDAMDAIGRGADVTLFTASDFGRTLASNGDGSDHGWGSHHFVVGGAVNGGDIYGQFPVTSLGTAHDVGNGRLLPSVSVQQFAARLGAWLGVPAGDLNAALPGLDQFPSGGLAFV